MSLYNQFVNHYNLMAEAGKIQRHYDAAWERIDRSAEVDAVRSFLLDKGVGVDYLNHVVAPELCHTGFDIKFASIFCHQKPRVKRTKANVSIHPGDTPSCELGDLFVLFLLIDGSDVLHYSAGALFQAKLRPKLDSISQRSLYDFDSEYEVPSYLANRFSPAKPIRKLPRYEEGRGRALRYLILSPDYPESDIRARHVPWTHTYPCGWSTFLHGLMSGTDGLRARPGSPKPSSWDKIVEDLLYVGLRASKSSKKPPRGNNIAVEVATSLFNNFRNLGDATAIVEEQLPGVPTMLIIAHAYDYKSGRE